MNTIQLIGRLTADPELRSTTGGTPVCTIRLAVPRRRRKGEAEVVPVYVSIVTYGAQGEAVAAYLTKGRRVAVTGRLDHREWTGGDGARHSTHEVVATQVDFLQAPAGHPDTAEADGSPEAI